MLDMIKNIPEFLEQAISNTFSIQIGTPVTIVTSLKENAKSDHMAVDCMSVLGMKSSTHQGHLAIGFPRPTFLAILQAMIGEKHENIDETNSDASGEILNIIYGDFRKKLNGMGCDFQPSIPTTVLGQKMSLFQTNSQVIIDAKVTGSLGEFVVILNIGLAEKKD